MKTGCLGGHFFDLLFYRSVLGCIEHWQESLSREDNCESKEKFLSRSRKFDSFQFSIYSRFLCVARYISLSTLDFREWQEQIIFPLSISLYWVVSLSVRPTSSKFQQGVGRIVTGINRTLISLIWFYSYSRKFLFLPSENMNNIFLFPVSKFMTGISNFLILVSKSEITISQLLFWLSSLPVVYPHNP